jgi:L-aspartate oxidase
MKTDILVIGAGIAGLSFAAKTAKWFPDLRITMITKDTFLESNTKYAQGGIAIVIDSTKDSFEKHVEDTLRAGDGLCNREVVEKVVSEGPDRLRELIEWGVQFDRDATGHLALGREGGHTEHRIIHYKDTTGYQIADALLKHLGTLPNVKLLSHHFAVDLLTERQESGEVVCTGAVAIDIFENVVRTFTAKVTLLATGGAGQVYATTTNPVIATGDGIAMAHRAGAAVKDMEFVQFHPTAFYSENDNPSFLISEAVRGFGAYLRTRDGDRFVLNYDQRGELASRDIVSKAIHNEICTRNEKEVYLDCTHLPAKELIEQFPTIYDQCLQKGVDITRDFIPVAPAAHYLCGGVEVDINGRTTIANLYACGECSYTGLHGANRLASNSLLEALVYSHQIFLDIERRIRQVPMPDSPPREEKEFIASELEQWIQDQKEKVRQRMGRDVGIVRNYNDLMANFTFLANLAVRIEELYCENPLMAQLCELRNIIDVAMLITSHSINRKENCGTYYNSDLLKNGKS